MGKVGLWEMEVVERGEGDKVVEVHSGINNEKLKENDQKK